MMRAQYCRAADVVVHRVVRSENPRDVNYLLISYVYTYLYIPLRVTSPVQFLSNLSYTSIGNESGAKISAFT